MTDLNSTAGAAAVTAGGMITITGGVFGMQFDTLIVGFLAGLVALSFQEKQSYWRMLSTVFSSSILAGSFAPVWSVAVVHYVPFLAPVGAEATNVASAASIGVLAQTVMPVGLERLRNFVANLKPEAKK